MQAAVLEEDKKLGVSKAIERPSPNSDGIVTKLDVNGGCRCDPHGWLGNGEWLDYKPSLGHSLGHGPFGPVIEAREDGSDDWEGTIEYQTAGKSAAIDCTRDNGGY